MKRTFKSLLAIAGLAFIGLGSLLTATPAHADMTEGPFNTVTCIKRTGLAYPRDGHFFYCVSGGTNESSMVTAIDTVLNQYPAVKTKLIANGVNIYIFKDVLEQTKFFKGTTAPTPTELQNAYTDNVGVFGESTNSPYRTVLYENKASGAYPTTAVIPVGEMQRVSYHEIGHQYDFGTSMSTDPVYKRYVNIDQSWMDATAVSPTGPTLRSNYSTQLAPTTTLQWVELFAEEFATRAVQQTNIGTYSNVSNQAIKPYFSCSRAYVHAKIVNATSSPAQADFDALDTATDTSVYERCSSGVYCFEQGKTLNNYPLDGNNVAGATHAFRCNNLETGVKPSDPRTQELFTSSLQNLPANVKTKLKAHNVKYFFFNNRSEANAYYQAYAPYKTNSTNYVTSSAICAETASLGTGADVAVSIYDNCSYSSGLTQNPNLRKTSFNESGVAFGIALNPSLPTFSKSGFTTLFSSDKTALVPANWYTTMTQPQRFNFLCNMYGTSAVSALEAQYGASSTPTATGGAVCVGGTPDTLYQPTPNDPNFVATLKMPWIMNSSKELWAEAFLITIDSSTSPSSYLPTTDRAIGSFQTPTPRAFNCTRAVVESYINTLAAPSAATLTSKGCNSAPGPL